VPPKPGAPGEIRTPDPKVRSLSSICFGGPLNFVLPEWLLYEVRDDTRKALSEKYGVSGEFADSIVALRHRMRRDDQQLRARAIAGGIGSFPL
jgi:hypothetical protein